MYHHKTNRSFHVLADPEQQIQEGWAFSLPQPYTLEINEDPEQLQYRYAMRDMRVGYGDEELERVGLEEIGGR